MRKARVTIINPLNILLKSKGVKQKTLAEKLKEAGHAEVTLAMINNWNRDTNPRAVKAHLLPAMAQILEIEEEELGMVLGRVRIECTSEMTTPLQTFVDARDLEYIIALIKFTGKKIAVSKIPFVLKTREYFE